VTSALLVVALLAAPQEPPAAQPTPTASASPQPAPAPATDDDRLRKVQERRAALEQELKKMRGEEKSLLGEVEQLELELQLRSDELVEIQISLKRTRAQLDATVLRVKQLETSLAEARPALARHARALYKLGDTSYLRLLLSIDRHVRVVNGAQSSLAFGATFPEARDRFWSGARLQEEWIKPGRRFLITAVDPQRSVVRTLPPGTVHTIMRSGGRWLYANVGD